MRTLHFLPGHDEGVKTEMAEAVKRMKEARAKREARRLVRRKRGRDLRKRPL